MLNHSSYNTESELVSCLYNLLTCNILIFFDESIDLFLPLSFLLSPNIRNNQLTNTSTEPFTSTDQVYCLLLRYIVHLDNNDIFIDNHFRRNSKVILDQDIIECNKI